MSFHIYADVLYHDELNSFLLSAVSFGAIKLQNQIT